MTLRKVIAPAHKTPPTRRADIGSYRQRPGWRQPCSGRGSVILQPAKSRLHPNIGRCASSRTLVTPRAYSEVYLMVCEIRVYGDTEKRASAFVEPNNSVNPDSRWYWGGPVRIDKFIASLNEIMSSIRMSPGWQACVLRQEISWDL
jgi:hypothetical protein